jgi:hypothetical protein
MTKTTADIGTLVLAATRKDLMIIKVFIRAVAKESLLNVAFGNAKRKALKSYRS